MTTVNDILTQDRWTGRHLIVAGFGRSGQAAARYAVARGARVTVCDDGAAASFATACAAMPAGDITYRFGAASAAPYATADLVVASPGIPDAHPGLTAARAAGIPIVCEMELAIAACSTPMIAVSGTNGKSTTVTLIGRILEAADIPVVVGGNLGTPLLDQVDAARAARWWVVEISSYQLERTPSLRPHVAVLLNITPDHLDRYRDFAAYAAAKALLVRALSPEATLIFNRDDAEVVQQVTSCRARRVGFSVGEVPWDLRTARLVGLHNVENMVAAGWAARTVGVADAVIQRALCAFEGLPHRCQLVQTWRQIRFYDDSKGTNVGSVVRSLEGFAAPVVLLAGGLDKGTGYAELREPVRRRVKSLVLFGQARELIARDLADCAETIMVETMAEAVRAALTRATAGDVVLLSPACASFDQYRNYAERGDDFIHCVRTMTAEEDQGRE